MGTEPSQDGDPIDEFVRAVDASGELDGDSMEDALLWLHSSLRSLGCNPEDPNTYRTIIAFGTLLRGWKPVMWALALNELIRVSLRALRDLNRRGGGS